MATPGVSVGVLNDYARAGHVLGGHRHATVSVGWDPVIGRHRVHDLLLWRLDVYRHGLLIPVHGLLISVHGLLVSVHGLGVRSVHVAISTGWNSYCGRNWVLNRPRVVL